MNVNKLKGVIRGAGLNQEEVAQKMGISLSRFNAKLNARGGAEFLLDELLALKNILGLSDRDFCDIFIH